MTNQPYQPIFILPEGSNRNTGKDAQRMNIEAAKLVAETIRTTLGPKGMDKMIVDSTGAVTITNDGATILREMNIEHPSAKMVVEIANTQEEAVGDGTTTAVILAGELLKQAETLLEQHIHPTIITKGYRAALEQAHIILQNISKPLAKEDRRALKNIALTAMTGKGAEHVKETLANIIVEAASISGIQREDIVIHKQVGGRVDEAELIKGVVIDRERCYPNMPKKVLQARILLIDSALEIKSTDADTKISITDPDKLQQFIDREERYLKELVNTIYESGANAVFCQKGIDDLAQHFLAKKGIYAARRVRRADLERLARATHASVVSDIKELSTENLGRAGLVEEVRTGEEAITIVRECKEPKTVTIMIRGGTEHVIAEIGRAVEDAIGDLTTALKYQLVVAGAGAPEVALAKELQAYSQQFSGKEQLAVKAYAQAMESIPRTLAENAGLDPIDVLASIKAAHEQGRATTGINVYTGKTMDAWKQGVIEPLHVKTHAISSATEVAVMILRIDDVIVNEKPRPSPQTMNEEL